MENYWMINEMGKTRHEDFVREAKRARRFLTSKTHRRLSTLVQGLMLIFG